MWRAALAMMFACVWVSCAAPQMVQDDPHSAAPPDFCLDIAILAGSSVDQTHSVHRRQSRFVLFPDGVFHYGIDVKREHGAEWLPPPVRVLSRRQVAEVWSLAKQSGLLDPDSAQPSMNFKLVQPMPDEVISLAAFSGEGKSWSHVGKSRGAEVPDAALTLFVRRLARLAWAADELPPEAAVLPKRYDFGPDPYERYRSR